MIFSGPVYGVHTVVVEPTEADKNRPGYRELIAAQAAKPKFCRDCRHFRNDGGFVGRCAHPSVETLSTLMDGDPPPDHHTLDWTFMRLTRCGFAGTLWKAMK